MCLFGALEPPDHRHSALNPEPIDPKHDLNPLVAQWIHFTLFGIILPTINLKVYTFWGL